MPAQNGGRAPRRRPDDPPDPPRGADRLSLIGGLQRRKDGSGMSPLAGPRLTIPVEAAMARGFEFPDDRATAAQKKALDAMFTEYLRRGSIYRNQHLPGKALAASLGISTRKADYMLAEARAGIGGPTGRLVVDVLHGMLSGKLAGVRGYRRDTTNADIFKIVYNCDMYECELQIRLHHDDQNRRVDRADIQGNFDQYRMLRAAFRLEYMEWSRSR